MRDAPAVTLSPQNTLDLGKQFTNILDRLDSIERANRMHGQSLAHAHEGIKQNRTAIESLDRDICQYKAFITDTHKRMVEHFFEKDRELGEFVQTLTAQLESVVTLMSSIVEPLMAQAQTHSDHLQFMDMYL